MLRPLPYRVAVIRKSLQSTGAFPGNLLTLTADAGVCPENVI
ncbi:hypothetical protein EPIR_3372 [Erwinia piriflorinigrans CFBP 5888]|uniref:Uncharacterized protein n=1 Tax=Erwinia piriflorinigrans CFBP 5888 TaxID=1161919 RepID=V5ZBT8_9GAMM|nr:hypothetical protein EPIR_3372 [Erwinia piriflorinigrans CFBP 5888]